MKKLFLFVFLLFSYQKLLASDLRELIIVLEGTSSAGKSTTAAALEKHFHEEYPNRSILSTGEDEIGKRFSDFLKNRLVETGLQTSITQAHNLTPDIDLFSDAAIIHMTDLEKQQLEDLVETEGQDWKNNQLAFMALQAYQDHKIVILDVLEATPVIVALEEKQVPHKNICTALLFVPFQKYPERVRNRNKAAIQAYTDDPTSDADGNLRDVLDLIEQYGLFFNVEAESTENTVQEITPTVLHATFEQAKNDSIELFTQMAEIYQKHGLPDKAQAVLGEINMMQERADEIIQARIQHINPLSLEYGYLIVNHSVDTILNTDIFSTQDLVAKILAACQKT